MKKSKIKGKCKETRIVGHMSDTNRKYTKNEAIKYTQNTVKPTLSSGGGGGDSCAITITNSMKIMVCLMLLL